MATLPLGLSLVVATLQGPKANNMNGDYPLSATPGADKSGSKFPKRFSDYPGDVEFFDVYSPPIRSTYGEVFWTLLDPVPLPQSIVAKYAGKGMAVVGFETNQVRRMATGEEVSVPINVAYNHHFESTMTGNKSVLEKVKLGGPDDPRRHGHGHGTPSANFAWVVRELAPGIKVGGKALPTSQDFGGANGGEYRKSFHGYAPGYVQVIESPTTWHITPMQIDTWNRELMALDGSTPFVPGPLPASALSPGSRNVPAKSPSDILYSGLLECPVTSRIIKHVQAGYVPLSSGQAGGCEGAVGSLKSAAECFAAAKDLGSSLCGASMTTHRVESDDVASDGV